MYLGLVSLTLDGVLHFRQHEVHDSFPGESNSHLGNKTLLHKTVFLLRNAGASK